eukprot:4694339-Alexandrium_andersonii.AAC.1
MGPPVQVNPGGHGLRRRLPAPVKLAPDYVPPGRAHVGGEEPADGQRDVAHAHPAPVPLLQEDQAPRRVLVRGGTERRSLARTAGPQHRTYHSP